MIGDEHPAIPSPPEDVQIVFSFINVLVVLVCNVDVTFGHDDETKQLNDHSVDWAVIADVIEAALAAVNRLL